MSDQVWVEELRAQLEAHPDAELHLYDYEDSTPLTIYDVRFDGTDIQVGIQAE